MVILFVFGFDLNQRRFFSKCLIFQIGWNGRDFKVIDLAEFFRLGQGGAGHASQRSVHAEVVLQRDGSVGDVLGFDPHALLGFYRLMQPV